MVFSQTSHKTQSILKVVEIDLLKAEKSQQVNGTTGVVTDRHTVATPSPAASSSYSEVFLKTEPEFPSTMTHESDYEFFEDLAQWCAAPAAAAAAQSIDIPIYTEDRAHNTDTLHTPFSPQGWDVFDVNSSAQASFYKPTVDPLSPSADGSVDFYTKYRPLEHENKIPFSEQFLDISSLPVVIEDLASRGAAGMAPWEIPAPLGWHPHDTEHNKNNTNIHNTLPFIEEDSLDMKMVSVIPREVESNNVVISEFILNEHRDEVDGAAGPGRARGLSVDVAARAPAWPNDDDIISTPEVLNYVEQLETEKCTLPSPTPVALDWPTLDASTDSFTKAETSPPMDYEPITPKSESHNEVESDNEDGKSYSSKKRRDSEDSDRTYVPYTEHSPRRYRKRKPSIPIKDMIRALEGSQHLKPTRRGRPPKRRESAVSSVCSVDETSSSASTHELRYRELRDKNNEASKRSRMNRKLKELQMEQLAIELEEKNKKLRVRAEILEEMTKKIRADFMSAVSQNRLNS
ncbi:hypothetical protein RR46_03373 [Papilio xuthus]|uniref:BZIP domain-containing protein n=2 Tax=Papilio xuthus TaxID=66420 RepID=A0A194Q3R7_PAPXU|nr:hypothetical protein RR46_03373 [Papilio xuthus]